MSNPAPQGPFPRIDTDPEFTQVVKYFRPSDYAVWGLSAAGFPTLFTLFEKFDPVNGKKFVKPTGSLLRVCTTLGTIGGFLIAYNRSTQRFWGWSENATELSKFKSDVKQKLLKGEPVYGKSSLSPWIQDVANRNSQNSQVALSILPWFNFVSHPYHGNEGLINEIKAEIAKE